MNRMTKKEKRELIASAMKTISEQEGLSPEARKRGITSLEQAYNKNQDSK
ncbi:MAG TPA: hypothetical protein GXZ55_05110 [Natronincola sp.]|nr:hypothetical protein [Natronincola sp.]